MNEDRIEGTTKKVVGSAQKTVGKIANDDKLETRGIVNQAAGAVQDGYGKVRDKVRDLIDEAPATAKDVVETGRAYAQRGSAAITRTAGDNTALTLLAAGVLGAALGWLAYRSRGSKREK